MIPIASYNYIGIHGVYKPTFTSLGGGATLLSNQPFFQAADDIPVGKGGRQKRVLKESIQAIQCHPGVSESVTNLSNFHGFHDFWDDFRDDFKLVL